MDAKMKIYEASRKVPEEAKKTINAGRLKGMTDINPMWRIKKLTELFGICGIGWYFSVDKQWVEDCGNETVAFVNISLFVKEDGEWSKPIFGTGGSKLVAMERNGAYVSDEAFKMATTDAISVACKHLGMAADVYFSKDRTKYDNAVDETASGIDLNQKISEKDLKILEGMLEGKEKTKQWFLEQFKIGSLAEMTNQQFGNAMQALKAKEAKDKA